MTPSPKRTLVVRFIVWFLSVVSLLVLLILNLSLVGAALRFSLVTLCDWTGEKVFAWSVLALLLLLLIVGPLLVAWRLGRFGFMKNVNKPILSFVLLLATNLPLVPALFALHPAPVIASSQASWLAQTLIRPQSLIGRAVSWLFDKDVVSGRVFIDPTGEVLVSQRLEPLTGNFQGSELAVIEVDGSFGYLARTGQMVIPPSFARAFPFSDGHAFVCPQGQTLFGIVDSSGKITVEPKFQNGTMFKEGLAYVVDDQGQGLVDSQGNWVLKLDLKPAQTPVVSDGLIHVVTASGTTYYDLKGQEFLTVPAMCGPFSKNLAVAQDRTSGLFGYIDRQGSWVIPALYKDAKSFSEELAAVQTEPNRWNFIDPSGSIVIQNVILDPEQSHFREGRCAVQKDGLWGFMDSSGKVVVDYQFHQVRPFDEGLAQVFKTNYYGFVNLKGDLQIAPRFVGSLGPSQLWANFEQGVCAAPFFQSRLGLLLGNGGGPGLPSTGLKWTAGSTIELKVGDSPRPTSTPTITATPSPEETPMTPSPTPAVDVTPNLSLEIGLGSRAEQPESSPQFDRTTKKIFAFITLSAEQTGNLEVVWSTLEPNLKFDLTDRAQTEGNTTETFFANAPSEGWQAGEYQVDVRLNGTLMGRRSFEISAGEKASKSKLLFIGSNNLFLWTEDQGIKPLTSFDKKDNLSDASWSPDGQKIVFTKAADLWLLDVPSNKLTQLTKQPTLDYMGAWSPDGKTIAFTTRRNGTEEIYSIRPDGSELTNLSRHPKPDADVKNGDFKPIWSPDGREIMFSSRRNGYSDVFIVNVENGELREVAPHSGTDHAEAWSPDGKKVLISSSRAPNKILHIVDLKDNVATPLKVPGVRNDQSASWSPDGQWLAFTSNLTTESGSQPRDLFICHPDGSEFQKIATTSTPNAPAWTSDSQKLTWRGDDNNTFHTYDLASETTQEFTSPEEVVHDSRDWWP
jgi:Tol biopolymer transport system component